MSPEPQMRELWCGCIQWGLGSSRSLDLCMYRKELCCSSKLMTVVDSLLKSLGDTRPKKLARYNFYRGSLNGDTRHGWCMTLLL
ncbi:rCG26546 [Rattus norvegicus]|uniref:RCG26546 n=1 Tax=Rattus norvegicus TaxID=10116 RepID=A6HQ57_RAT|nr:rCG26546 [Rattus norvegicus]